MYLITCRTVCAADPSAHHAVKGRIVTCSKLWKRVNGTGTYSDRLAQAAFTLTHEMLHHVAVFVDGAWRPIGDYHTLGVPDGHYYGITDVTYLARHEPMGAVRNNDSYAFFAQQATQDAHVLRERSRGRVRARPEPVVFHNCSFKRTRTWRTVDAARTQSSP